MTVSLDGLVVLLVGCGLLCFGTWSWRGRSTRARWWVGDSLNERVVRGMIPALLVFLASAVGIKLTGGADGESFASYVAALGMLIAVLLIAWTVMMIPLPRWWAPAWFRKLSESEQGPRTKGALSSFLAMPRLERLGTVDSRTASGVSESRELDSWRCNYVCDPDSKERGHGLAGRGMVGGRLVLFEERLVFYATTAEDALRGEPTVVDVDLRDISDVRVVAARAGADGVPRPGRLYRSALPRLVVTSGDKDYVYEVTRASRTARAIEEAQTPVRE